MSQCSNCYGGCLEIVSDKCVKYTGVNIPLLGIQNGDSISYVQQAIITFLSSALDGTAIIPTLPEEVVCELVSKHLPTCKDISIVDVAVAIIKGLCELQIEVNTNTEDIADINLILSVLNANYNVQCLDGVSSTTDTHDILQATINKVCSFITYANATFVKATDLCTLVTACINAGTGANKAYSKMVPYTIVEYYGPLSNYPNTGDTFDGTGAGQGYWQKVYLCNGLNGTPDKRGRVSVGVTDGTIGGTTMSADVNPASSIFNPSYSKGIPFNGSNSTILSQSQIPAHTHTATAISTVVEPNSGQGHKHNILTNGRAGDPPNSNVAIGDEGGQPVQETEYAVTGITVNTTVTNASTGGGQPFSNVQPAIGAVYIIYIP
jgi:microcystin-dependent protein